MYRLSAREIHEKFITGQVSARSIADYFLERVQKEDPKTDAFLTVFSDDIRTKADLLDEKKAKGALLGGGGGVPVAIKDNIHVHGKITTCGSHFLSNYKAVFNATVVNNLEAEDALLIGKTN
ncbi:MAG: Asp-tRNA(Asn)/Glu-tRNA(Gln) amidotransferase subunit GatA, partial [Verrucomicrobia bacterium]|nr:Asp-tRNA(Asn)/Glu-tRNA(Gln) amidotransferase subunit GatA [Verrucomicrobiota bacterium]